MRNIDRIVEAIADLESQEAPNVAATARKFDINRKTLENRWKGKSVPIREAISMHRQCLTNSQERSLIAFINKLTSYRMPPTTAIVKNLAEEIRGRAVGKNWTAQFVHRHQDELKSLYLKGMDQKRIKSEFPKAYELFYQLLFEAIENHNITADNIYNVDEKGFLIGIGSKMRRIMSREAYEQGRCRQSSQDGSREFITLIAYSWVEQVAAEDDVFFGSTENGWTNDAYGMIWLQKPLDLNCFQPLATKYQVYLDQWRFRSLGQVSMSKRTFYEIFKPAWHESFSISNIQGGFRKAGIWPFSPSVVLDTILQRPTTPSKDETKPTKPPPTPMTSKSIRRAQKAYKAAPTQTNLDVILRSQERLAAQHEVDKHLNKGLLETLKNEKRRRQRGKKLNLVGEEDSGAQLFHSSRVRAALAFEAEKKAIATADKVEKDARKARALENKQLKEVEVQEKALQRQVDKEIKAQARAIKKEDYFVPRYPGCKSVVSMSEAFQEAEAEAGCVGAADNLQPYRRQTAFYSSDGLPHE
ncbi:hypothetical protein B7494_g5258 [Chlorociboria aeruginascens]|nr:hypothetical protein B7494_g5258 [Chlorociboria aeruginascens]